MEQVGEQLVIEKQAPDMGIEQMLGSGLGEVLSLNTTTRLMAAPGGLLGLLRVMASAATARQGVRSNCMRGVPCKGKA